MNSIISFQSHCSFDIGPKLHQSEESSYQSRTACIKRARVQCPCQASTQGKYKSIILYSAKTY